MQQLIDWAGCTNNYYGTLDSTELLVSLGCYNDVSFLLKNSEIQVKHFLIKLLAHVGLIWMISLPIPVHGVVATILHGRWTTYSRFIFSLNPQKKDICGFAKQDKAIELLQKAFLIIS